MFPSVLKFFIATVALSLTCYASAQDCSCNDFAPAAKQANKSRTWGLRNCGRDVSQQKAAGLWSGYCSADCSITVGGEDECGSQDCSGGCRSGSKFHGLFQKSSGCNDCESNCSQGCDNGCGHTCKIKQRLSGSGKHRNHRDNDCFGWPQGSNDCQSSPCTENADCGCGCKSGCKIRHLFASCKFSRDGLFQRSKEQCGCSGAYFDECVGYEYGTAGMQSCIGPIMEDTTLSEEAPGKPGGV